MNYGSDTWYPSTSEIDDKYVQSGMLCTDKADVNNDLRQETIEVDN